MLGRLKGIPKGTTHLLLFSSDVSWNNDCSVYQLKLDNGIWYIHTRDSDKEYPQFVPISRSFYQPDKWLAENEKHFISLEQLKC